MHFHFNVIGLEYTKDYPESINAISSRYGIPIEQNGCTSIASATVLVQESTAGGLGKHEGRTISIATNAPESTLPHEMGHALGLKDSFPNILGGIMDYPPASNLSPNEVDTIWNKMFWK